MSNFMVCKDEGYVKFGTHKLHNHNLITVKSLFIHYSAMYTKVDSFHKSLTFFADPHLKTTVITYYVLNSFG
jgi:hypothetical protein